jgi:hypothetical protein
MSVNAGAAGEVDYKFHDKYPWYFELIVALG